MKKTTLFAFALTVLSCHQPKIDKKAEGEKIIQQSREWARVVSTGNIEKTVSYWADDAIVIAAEEPPLEGKQAIRQMVEESFKISGFRIGWQPQTVVVSESGDMAYMIVTLNNKAVSIWGKQADGSWKNVVDISTPAPSQNK
jgi:ketosteroid isomerase-like protein